MNQLAESTKTKLRAKCDAPDSAEFEIIRTGKYIVYVTISVGSCLYGKYKFDCKKGTMSEA